MASPIAVRKRHHDDAAAERLVPLGKAVTNGSVVKRVTEGTAAMIPIQTGSTPTARSQTGKNGKWVPTRPKPVP